MAVKLALVNDPVPDAPVPAMVTFAVAVAVAVPVVGGAYCTMIVQVFPAATAAPETQVPPVMENVPPAVPTLAIVVALKVSCAPLAVTVIVPVLVAVVAGVVVSAGAGAEMVAPVTVKGSALVAPIGVVRPRLWIPSVAVAEIARLALT